MATHALVQSGTLNTKNKERPWLSQNHMQTMEFKSDSVFASLSKLLKKIYLSYIKQIIKENVLIIYVLTDVRKMAIFN